MANGLLDTGTEADAPNGSIGASCALAAGDGKKSFEVLCDTGEGARPPVELTFDGVSNSDPSDEPLLGDVCAPLGDLGEVLKMSPFAFFPENKLSSLLGDSVLSPNKEKSSAASSFAISTGKSVMTQANSILLQVPSFGLGTIVQSFLTAFSKMV